MEQIINSYYADNAKKLHGMVDKILLKFGGLSDKDRDDFYSLANEVFVDVMRRRGDLQAFDVFLYSCLSNRIKTEISKINCEKRMADRLAVSIDAPVGEDEDLTLGDLIADRFDMENAVLDKLGEGYGKRVILYLNRLSKLQKEVLKLTVDGYPSNEIREKLHINKKQYADCNAAIHSYRNVSVLLQRNEVIADLG